MSKILLIFILSLSLATLHAKAQNSPDSAVIQKTNSGSIYFDYGKSSDKARQLLNDNPEGTFVGINRYHGEYVLYAPCDWLFHKEVRVSKDSVYAQLGENITYAIVKRKGNTKKDLTVYKLKDSNHRKATLSVKAMDQVKHIYIAKFTAQEGESYFLVVPSQYVNDFKLIVNDCRSGKVEELKFDELDLRVQFNK